MPCWACTGRLAQHGIAWQLSTVPCSLAGNPQILGQKPMTFFRQVLSLCEYQDLMEHELAPQIYPPDVIAVRGVEAAWHLRHWRVPLCTCVSSPLPCPPCFAMQPACCIRLLVTTLAVSWGCPVAPCPATQLPRPAPYLPACALCSVRVTTWPTSQAAWAPTRRARVPSSCARRLPRWVRGLLFCTEAG